MTPLHLGIVRGLILELIGGMFVWALIDGRYLLAGMAAITAISEACR